MSHGSLSSVQRDVLRPFVSSKRVHDLGAGDLGLSKVLVELGASKVVAVDSRHLPRACPKGIEFKKSQFEAFKEPVETAFLSWPSNNSCRGLTEILKTASTVAYLGKNTDGTVCGTESLFRALWLRSVLAHVPERANTLIVYGPPCKEQRILLPEEYAMVYFNYERPWGYDELMKADLSLKPDNATERFFHEYAERNWP
jgi:hypothetical protein